MVLEGFWRQGFLITPLFVLIKNINIDSHATIDKEYFANRLPPSLPLAFVFAKLLQPY